MNHTRRQFLQTSAAAAAASLSLPGAARAAGPGYNWPPSPEDYRDPKTGARVRVLSPEGMPAQVIYQTHPMWVKDMAYFIFFALDGDTRIPMARQMGSGLVRPMAKSTVGAMVVDVKHASLIFARGRDLFRQPVEATFQRLRAAEKVAALPNWIDEIAGGFSLDANRRTLYAGARLNEAKRWALTEFDTGTNTWRVRCPVDFQIGHVQAHPRVPGLVMFCHETGGDAPQRMWRVMPEERDAAPMYKEQGEEWVTHEVWWNDRALFTIWPYNEDRLNYRYGVVSVDLQGANARWHAKYKAWHTHGSPDGQWILGDDFDRNLWLIAPSGQERRLLSQGHNAGGFKTHPHASFTPDSKAVVTNSSRLGREAVMLVELP